MCPSPTMERIIFTSNWSRPNHLKLCLMQVRHGERSNEVHVIHCEIEKKSHLSYQKTWKLQLYNKLHPILGNS